MEDIENKNLQQQSESEQKNVPDNVDYIEAIKEMKQNTVNKQDYLKLKEENKKLIQSLVNGEQLDPAKQKKEVDVNKLRENLFKKEQNNLEYITNALELRNALIEKGEKDPFLPYGKNILPTDEDIECAERVARVLQECVDYADGNSDIFTNELQRVMVDTGPQIKNKLNRR